MAQAGASKHGRDSRNAAYVCVQIRHLILTDATMTGLVGAEPVQQVSVKRSRKGVDCPMISCGLSFRGLGCLGVDDCKSRLASATGAIVIDVIAACKSLFGGARTPPPPCRDVWDSPCCQVRVQIRRERRDERSGFMARALVGCDVVGHEHWEVTLKAVVRHVFLDPEVLRALEREAEATR